MENFDFASNVSAPLKAGMQSMGAAALKSEGLRRSRSAPSRILAPVGKEIPCGIGSARRAGAAMERRILAESGVSAPMLGKPAGFLPQNARSERAKRGGERILPAICAFPTPCRFFCYMAARRINQFARGAIYSGRDSNPYGQRPADFKSAASTIPPPEPNCLFYGAPPAFRTSGFLKCEYSKNPPQIKAFLARRRPGLSDSPAFFASKAFRNFVRVRKIPTIAHGK